ncbi:hypothetical protein Hanom_Chr16g01442591 [Helianthus anomalus]
MLAFDSTTCSFDLFVLTDLPLLTFVAGFGIELDMSAFSSFLNMLLNVSEDAPVAVLDD